MEASSTDPQPVDPERAVTPEPDAGPHEKTYEVTGEANFVLSDGSEHSKGDKFNATLPYQQEAFLTEYGHLKVIADPANPLPDPPVVTEVTTPQATEPEAETPQESESATTESTEPEE